MKIKKTKFKGLIILNGIKHKDKRGYLRELVLEKLIKKKFKFQITSVSKKNVLRGLHFQIIKPQGKLISELKSLKIIKLLFFFFSLISDAIPNFFSLLLSFLFL